MRQSNYQVRSIPRSHFYLTRYDINDPDHASSGNMPRPRNETGQQEKGELDN